jgi:ferritin-like protein
MSTELHEGRDALSSSTLDDKRAIDSMKEELEAIDWYRQRAEATGDPALRALLEHHRAEEIEHFVMLLEWLRRRDAALQRHLATYLYSEGDLTELEHEEKGKSPASAPPSRARRTIGSLKEKP